MLAKDSQTTLVLILNKYNRDRTELLAILREVQEQWRYLSPEILAFIADELDLPHVYVTGTATFYHFFTTEHAGNYTIYINTSVTAEMFGVKDIITAFEQALGIKLGQNTPGNKIGLRKTSCIGMSDQEPAILINGYVFPKVTPDQVNELVAGMRANFPIQQLMKYKIDNTIRLAGPVFFTDYIAGIALSKALDLDSLEIIEMIKDSGLRGRGGAGFATGQKWGFCRAAVADTRYVMCNVDEGEPGTFKDRVLLTELAELIFEGMTIAGYAVEAKQGFVYLRAEYGYLRPALEETLTRLRNKNLLGKHILGTRFSFDISIKMGAGAYICGEESALIESAEGKRGQPRNRPPFPVTAGYLHKPTIVNNPETFGCAVKILLYGADWFKQFGTPASSGVKLLSIAGDCKYPGIYEVPWGKTVQEILTLCGAADPLAVQVGGPSGTCLSAEQFNRKLCYSDLATGGAFTIFGQERDLLAIVRNYMEFFVAESCGFCVPCRAGNTLLLKTLEKIICGKATVTDLTAIKDLGRLVKTTSRCGLGQTSPNPLLTTLKNFTNLYLSKVNQDIDYLSVFDFQQAVADSCNAANRLTTLDQDAEE